MIPAATPGASVTARRPLDNQPPAAVAGGELLPPRATATKTLRKLQEAALVGFGERGYHGVSIRELAEAAGVRVSSIYSHVSAKEDLLLELMVVGHEEHNARLRAALLSSQPDPRAQMEALVKAHVTMHATYPLLTRVNNKELHALSPENAARVMAVRHDSEQMFVDVMDRGVAEGVFHTRDAWITMAAIGGMGIRVAEWFDPAGSIGIDEVADQYAEIALKMLA